MLRAVIVENVPKAIEALQQALSSYCPEVSVIGSWRTVAEAVKGIHENQPDLVFLDIELDNNESGFEILEKIPNRNFEVIFVTAYNKYAVRAFQFSAVHYLEKPVDGTLLSEAIERVKVKRSENEFRQQLQVLSESLRNLASTPRQIILPNPKQGDSIVVPLNDVVRLEGSNSQTIFYIFWNGKRERTIYSMTIGTVYKKMLQGHDDFIMIHESNIVNRRYITHYNSQSHAVKMADETFIKVADRRLSQFLQKFNRA